MSIEVTCKCGKLLHAKDEHAGRKVKCGICGAILDVPAAPLDSAPVPDGVAIANLQQGLEQDQIGSAREATLTDVWKVLNAIAGSLGAAKNGSGANQHREYKVITQNDQWFSGKFDPEQVEGALNSYAKQGWVMKGVATANIAGVMGGQREEVIIIMER